MSNKKQILPSVRGGPVQLILSTNSQQPRIEKEGGQEACQFLRSLEVFLQIPDDKLKTLAAATHFASIAHGQYITNEGAPETSYGFIVASGRLAMMKTSISGKELVVELLPPGDIFGLLLTLSSENLPSQLSARAQSKSIVLWVPILELTYVLNAHPEIYKNVVAHLFRCLQSSYRISRGLAHDQVDVRIATVLVSLSLKFSRPLPALQDNTIDITRQQLADLTGTTPETANRVTRQMQRDGLIDLNPPGVIRVLDLVALQTLANG